MRTVNRGGEGLRLACLALVGTLAACGGGGIKTVTGSITMSGPSRIEIEPGTTVQGALRFEREVKLYVSDRATIGTVTGATPITFSGTAPPDG